MTNSISFKSRPIDLIALLDAESVMIRSARNLMYLSSPYEKTYVVVSQRVFGVDVFNIPNRKVYSDRKTRMNEIVDDRYCSTKINQMGMFKKLLFDGKTKKKNQCMTVEAILKEKKTNKLVQEIRRKQQQ